MVILMDDTGKHGRQGGILNIIISVGEIYMFANCVGCSWRTSVPSL
jgi:hypothetical protein